MRRRALVLLIGLTMATAAGRAQADASPAEKALLGLTNQARAEHGLGPLAWDGALARAARAHAERVVSEPGALEHQYAGEPDLVARTAAAGAHFGTVAENLARWGRTPAELQQKLMSTTAHRENILDPRLNAVGIGIVERGGLLFAVEDFAKSVAAPQKGGVEGQVMASLRAAGMTAVKPTEVARASCLAGRDTALGTAGQAALAVAWDGSDPGKLPEALVQQIGSGRFHSAAVGACPSQRVQPGFTTYKVMVLLY